MKFVIGYILLALIVISVSAHDHPMVAIVAYPGSPTDIQANSYIQVESSKFIESTGARTIAIKTWNASTEPVLGNINGILVQNSVNGEMSQDQGWIDTLKSIYEHIIGQHSLGVTFPLWTSGITALQFSQVMSETQDLSQYTVNIDASDYATTLNVIEFKTPNKHVSLTGNIKFAFLEPVFHNNIAYFNQTKGITVESLKNDALLSANFEIVATARDKNGLEFIAIMKGKTVPIILSFVLFEKVYNFYPYTNVPHTDEATRLSVQFSKSFTDICRVNDNTYGSISAEYENNIYNHKLTNSVGVEFQTFYF
jgi:gamma-glutamyl hydrolase